MTDLIRFVLDGREAIAAPGETIWQAAEREGVTIPHLCWKPAPGYRADGNCRACMVEIEGERTLAASCIRKPTPGLKVITASERARKARAMVMELLIADQPPRERAHDRIAPFWIWAEAQGVSTSRFPATREDPVVPLTRLDPAGLGTLSREGRGDALDRSADISGGEPLPLPSRERVVPSGGEGPGEGAAVSPAEEQAGRQPLTDLSHPAMAVNLDACIQCTLCVRACREVQVNDVIGMAYRGFGEKVVFDFDDPMGESTCVACGECVQACPTGALMPASIVDPATQIGTRGAEREVASVCPYCGVGCQISYKIRDGKIAYVDGLDGPANENRLCVKGRFGFDYVSHPHRLTKPLIRLPGKRKALDVDPGNPFTHFREASWDEALDAAAAGLGGLRDRFGGRSVAGFGSAKCSNEEAYLFQKLIRAGFGHNNVDHCTRLCHASSVAALIEGIGSGAVTASFNEALNADVVIVIGANPVENHPVAATYFKQAAKAGAKLIVMDPRGQALKRHAWRMLQFRPGTDVALLDAIMNVIVAEDLYDRQYVAAQTEGFERLKAHLAAFTPEAMAPVCGIAPEAIREVARTFARAERAMIFWGMGVSQHVHGTDNARCLISLALMCGHVGRPGTGLHPLRGQNNVQGASDAGLIPMFLPDYQGVGREEARRLVEDIWGTPVDPKPGLTVVEIIDAIDRGEIRGMYVQGENPAMSDPDASHAREALAKLECLVVQDIFLTETAMLADVVLPASAWPEKTGTVTNTNRQVQMGRKALEPPGEAREDWAITIELGKRLGMGWDYRSPADVFSEMKLVMPSLDNITWERLEAESSVTYPCPAPGHPGEVVVFGDRFPTKTGRATLVPASVTSPAETPDEDFPFILTTGRQLEHWHTGSMTRRAAALDALEPAPTASLHPLTMRRFGIAPGEIVRVATRRGAVEMAARADEAVQQDMIFIPFAYVEGAANVLTNPQLDPVGKIPEYKFCAARLEKIAMAVAAE